MIPENADSVFVPDTQDASNTSDKNPEIIFEETNLEENQDRKMLAVLNVIKY